MRNHSFLLLFFLSLNLFAQTNIQKLHTEINQSVWKPFQKAFETLDGEALNAIYAEEVLRVTPKGIDTGNNFKAGNLKRFKQNKLDGDSIALDFWFDSRHTNTTTSYEVGFYRISTKDREGVTTHNYGQFHIVLKKIDGKWRITQDWDTDVLNGNPIDKTDFVSNTPIKF